MTKYLRNEPTARAKRMIKLAYAKDIYTQDQLHYEPEHHQFWLLMRFTAHAIDLIHETVLNCDPSHCAECAYSLYPDACWRIQTYVKGSRITNEMICDAFDIGKNEYRQRIARMLKEE